MNDVEGSVNEAGIEYIPSKWHMFIDSFKYSVRDVLFRNEKN